MQRAVEAGGGPQTRARAGRTQHHDSRARAYHLVVDRPKHFEVPRPSEIGNTLGQLG